MKLDFNLSICHLIKFHFNRHHSLVQHSVVQKQQKRIGLVLLWHARHNSSFDKTQWTTKVISQQEIGLRWKWREKKIIKNKKQ